MAAQPASDLSRPARPRIVPAVELVASDDSLTFERARELAAKAKAEFAATNDVLVLKQRISHWANAHDDKRLARALKAIADYASGLTHSTSEFLDPAWLSIRDHYIELHGMSRSRNQFKADLRPAIDAGTVTVTGQFVSAEEASRTGKRTAVRKNNSYGFDFSRAIKTTWTRDPVTGREIPHHTVVPWDFTQRSSYYSEASSIDSGSESITDTGSDSGRDTGSDTVQFSSSSVYSSNTVSSKGREEVVLGKAKEREEGAARTDPGNIYIVWQAKSGDRKGEWLDFSMASRPRHQPKDARVISLTPDEAKYMRQTWPMLRRLPPADRAERAEQRARFLLMDSTERAVLLNGTLAPAAAEQQEKELDDRAPMDRVLEYLVENDELDLTTGLPEELSDIGMIAVLDVCDKLTRDRRFGLCGSRSLQKYGLSDNGRDYLAQYFLYSTMWRVLAGRRAGIWSWELGELAHQYGIDESEVRGVLDHFVIEGDATLTDDRYRLADTENAN